MKLSEAIRLGSMMKPQAFGTLNDGRGTCVLGAAEEAAGHVWLMWRPHPAFGARCPICAYVPSAFKLTTPAHLNDEHRWARERIADWVEQIEQQQEASTPVVEVAHG